MLGIFSNDDSLTEAPGRTKLLIALPLAALAGLLAYLGVFSALSLGIGAACLAYGVVGLVEVVMGARLRDAADRWDGLPAWRKFLISAVVIAAALALAAAAVPLLASQTS